MNDTDETSTPETDRFASFPHRVELSSDDREARRACVLDEIPDAIRSLV